MTVNPEFSKGIRWLAVLLVACAVLLPRLFELDRFVTVDEPEWLFQSGNFYYALGQRDFAETYRREHPGVVTLWAGTAGYIWKFPEYRGLGQGYLPTAQGEDFMRAQGKDPLELLKAGRTVMVAVTTVVLTLAFIYARRLFGDWPALIGFLLLAFDPFHIGLTRLLHLDGMESNFVLLSLLALLVYLYRGRRWPDLAAAGAAGAVGMVSKSPGVFVFPFIALWTIIAFLRDRRDGQALTFWRHVLLPGIGFGLSAILTLALVWPSMWVHPIGTLQQMFSGAFGYAVTGHGANFFNGMVYRPGMVTWSDAPLYYPACILWRSTPVTVIGLSIAVVAFIRKLPPFEARKSRDAALGLVCFSLLFAAFMTLGGKKLDRYILPAITPLLMTAGLGWYALAAWLQSKFARLQGWRSQAVLLGLVAALQLASALPHFPYYLSYYDPLLGGGEKAPEVMMIGMGEGLDLAADYLNQKAGAKDMLVLSSIAYGSTSFYFEGRSEQIFRFDHKLSVEKREILNEVDYALVYVSGWQRTTSELDFFANAVPEKVITLNGIEYVRIYPRSELSFVLGD
jgi:hypothetical protein